MPFRSRGLRMDVEETTPRTKRPRPWTYRGGTLRRDGFTLIELSITIAIIGVLAAIASTSYQTYAMRARRSEAKVGLRSVFLTQTAYFGEFSIYGDTFSEIGTPIDGGVRVDSRTIRATTYTFTVRALPLDGKSNANFQGVATGDLDPGDGVLDILMIENQLLVLP